MVNSLLIRGGRVIDPKNGVDMIADVLVENGKIAAVGGNLAAEGGHQTNDLAANGSYSAAVS